VKNIGWLVCEAMGISPSERLRFWAHELGGMAKTGLLYADDDPYDHDRFDRVLAIAEGIAELTIDAEFRPDRPYLRDVGIVSPKTGCSCAAFDAAGRVVLIRRADNGRWALPGGYAEIGSSPSENALREFREETGYEAEVEALIGVYDNARFGSLSAYQFYICLFRARLTGGDAAPSRETLEVRLVDPDGPPADMSELQRMMLSDAAGRRGAAMFQ